MLEPLARASNATWWAFLASGVLAIAAAVAVLPGVVAAVLLTSAWLLAAGVMILVAIVRGPGIRASVPLLGAGVAGIALGIAFAAAYASLPDFDDRIVLTAVGIWSVLAGAGYLAIARVARAYRVPESRLYTLAWMAIAVGVAATTAPAFGFGGSALATAAATGATGAVTIAAALRLRDLPDAPPEAVSKREQRRRERSGPPG